MATLERLPDTFTLHSQRPSPTNHPSHSVADRLADLFIAVEGLRADFDSEEANSLRWLEPQVDAIWHDVDVLVRRLAQ